MPIIKSAKKRMRTAKKAAIRNSKTKRNLRGALKLFYKKSSSSSQNSAQSAVDIALKKGIVSKNKAARMKRQLAAKAKSAGVKVGQPKKIAVKPSVKKLPPKKPTPVKKSVTKKTKSSSK